MAEVAQPATKGLADFAAWRNWFRGEDAIVVAPGPSSREPGWSEAYRSHWTIGCNRAVGYCEPDVAVCVEPFVDTIWRTIRACSAATVFSHLCKDRRGRQPHPRIAQFPTKNVAAWFDPGTTDDLQCAMSPFWAAGVACWLGFSRVALIGVDLTKDRWPDPWRENRKWAALRQLLEAQGTFLFNLNPASRLEAIPAPQFLRLRGKAHEPGKPVAAS